MCSAAPWRRFEDMPTIDGRNTPQPVSQSRSNPTQDSVRELEGVPCLNEWLEVGDNDKWHREPIAVDFILRDFTSSLWALLSGQRSTAGSRLNQSSTAILLTHRNMPTHDEIRRSRPPCHGATLANVSMN